MTDQPDRDILHQDDVEEVIEAKVDEMGEGVFITSPEAAIANASVAHALNSTFSDTEAEAALNALGTKINAVLDALRAQNIIDT